MEESFLQQALGPLSEGDSGCQSPADRCKCGCVFPCACDLLNRSLQDILGELKDKVLSSRPAQTGENVLAVETGPSESKTGVLLAELSMTARADDNSRMRPQARQLEGDRKDFVASILEDNPAEMKDTGQHGLADGLLGIMGGGILDDLSGGNEQLVINQRPCRLLVGRPGNQLGSIGSTYHVDAGMAFGRESKNSVGRSREKRQENNKIASRLFRARRKQRYQELVEETINLSNENRALKAENQLLRSILTVGHPGPHLPSAIPMFDSCGCCVKRVQEPRPCASSLGEKGSRGSSAQAIASNVTKLHPRLSVSSPPVSYMHDREPRILAANPVGFPYTQTVPQTANRCLPVGKESSGQQQAGLQPMALQDGLGRGVKRYGGEGGRSVC